MCLITHRNQRVNFQIAQVPERPSEILSRQYRLHAEFAERFNFSSGALNNVIKRPFQVLPLGSSTNSHTERKGEEAPKGLELRLRPFQQPRAWSGQPWGASCRQGKPEAWRHSVKLISDQIPARECPIPPPYQRLRSRLIAKKKTDLIEDEDLTEDEVMWTSRVTKW